MARRSLSGGALPVVQTYPPLVCVAEARLNVGPRFCVVRGYQEMLVVIHPLVVESHGSSCVPRRPATTYIFQQRLFRPMLIPGCTLRKRIPLDFVGQVKNLQRGLLSEALGGR